MKRWMIWAIVILIVVGGFVGWQLHQARERNREIGESFTRQAEQLEKLRGK